LQSPSNADRFRWILGGYLESRQTENVPEEIEYTETAAGAFGLPSAGKDITTSSLDQNTYAAFGQIDYKPVEPLTLTAGLRYESFNNEIDRRRVFEVPGLAATPAGLELNGETSDGDIVLPKFAVEYGFNNNIATYASVTRGYKPGTLSYRAEELNLLEIRPEKSWNYEIGLKSAWLDNRVTANLALFWTKLDDYQAVLPDELGLFRNVVNANADINGLELEVTAKPLKGLDLIAGFGYVNAEFSDYTNPFTGQDFSGNNLLYAPEYTYNLAAQYKSSGGILTRLELQGFGKIFFDDANELSQDPYALVNGRIGYEGKNYGVYLFANNIFDKEYQTSSFVFPPPTVISSFGDRATYGVQVRAEF
jgi:iron complex outermembrane recepter protein